MPDRAIISCYPNGIRNFQIMHRNSTTWVRRLRAGLSWIAPATMILLTACAKPYVQPAAPHQTLPALTVSYAQMDDGYRLPLRRWHAPGEARAIVLALHGMNDYSNAFDKLGQYLAERGISVIAYDQRGFGSAEGRGLWHGSERLATDLITVARLLREHYGDTPLYLLGESMGGAVAISALASNTPSLDGAVLVAPAVWARDTMPYYQRALLWFAAHTIPSKKLTGKNLDITPSDNKEMLVALRRDDLVIKSTRVDVLYGISNLMDEAQAQSRRLSGRVLLLYGKHDEIIPPDPTCELFDSLSTARNTQLTALIYDNGYHMLTRDLQANVVLEDILAWIERNTSHSETNSRMKQYCIARTGIE